MGSVKELWGSFKELGELLCGSKLGLKQKGRLYKGCVRSDIGQKIGVWV